MLNENEVETEIETEMKKCTFVVSFDELYWVAQCKEYDIHVSGKRWNDLQGMMWIAFNAEAKEPGGLERLKYHSLDNGYVRS